MSRQRRFLCGVPENECTGSVTQNTKGWRGSRKSHVTREEAFTCKANNLVRHGYVRFGSKEFASPNDGPILLLNKKSKFGGVLRQGKEDRFMPRRGSGEVW